MSTASCDLTHVDLIDTRIVSLKEQLAHDCLTRIGLAVTCDEKTAILTSCNIKNTYFVFYVENTFSSSFHGVRDVSIASRTDSPYLRCRTPAGDFFSSPSLYFLRAPLKRKTRVWLSAQGKRMRCIGRNTRPFSRGGGKNFCFSYSVNLWRHRHGGRGTTNVISSEEALHTITVELHLRVSSFNRTIILSCLSVISPLSSVRILHKFSRINKSNK